MLCEWGRHLHESDGMRDCLSKSEGACLGQTLVPLSEQCLTYLRMRAKCLRCAVGADVMSLGEGDGRLSCLIAARPPDSPTAFYIVHET